jgi:hypothetical protein
MNVSRDVTLALGSNIQTALAVGWQHSAAHLWRTAAQDRHQGGKSATRRDDDED